MKILKKVAATTALATAPLMVTNTSWAATHSCVSNWCSGSDLNTTTNSQGNSSQIYLGEVGVYYSDSGITGSSLHNGPCTKTSTNPDGGCFSASAANAANLRAVNGTGMGTNFVWLLGGPNSQYEKRFASPYCFGWSQGVYAAYYGLSSSMFGDYASYAYLMFADIEQNGAFGWFGGASVTSAQMGENRAVINGFEDFVAGRNSKDAGCSGPGSTSWPFQYGVYSAPSQWSYMFTSSGGAANGQLPNTYIWTYENQLANDTDPGNFSSALSWASSSYLVGYQFHQNPDHDLFNEPQYMPALGSNWGH